MGRHDIRPAVHGPRARRGDRRVLLVVRAFFGGPWHGAPPYQGPPSRTPLDILKERFARGEIDKQDFEERRRVLGE